LQDQDQLQGQKAETSGEQAMWVAVMGRVAQDYRDRLGALDDSSDPDYVHLRERVQHVRSVELDMELRLIGLQAERDEIYRLRRKHLINDDSLRLLVSELDLAEVALMRRRTAAKRNRQEAEEAWAQVRSQESSQQDKGVLDVHTSTAAAKASETAPEVSSSGLASASQQAQPAAPVQASTTEPQKTA